MSIVRSESLLDAILTSNSVVLDTNQANTTPVPTSSNTNSGTILSPDPTEESLALASRNNQVDVSSFDSLVISNNNKIPSQATKPKRDKIQSFIEFDDDDEAVSGNNKSSQDRVGRSGQRSFSNGKSLDYSYCDNVELADVFSVPNSSKNSQNMQNHKAEVSNENGQEEEEEVEWAQFQSSEVRNSNTDSDSEVISDEIDTENNDEETFDGDDNV